MVRAEGGPHIIGAKDYVKPAGARAEIERAARLLADTERPTIIAGSGIVSAGAAAELLELAELLQAPVVTTQQSKGTIPDETRYSSASTIS